MRSRRDSKKRAALESIVRKRIRDHNLVVPPPSGEVVSAGLFPGAIPGDPISAYRYPEPCGCDGSVRNAEKGFPELAAYAPNDDGDIVCRFCWKVLQP